MRKQVIGWTAVVLVGLVTVGLYGQQQFGSSAGRPRLEGLSGHAWQPTPDRLEQPATATRLGGAAGLAQPSTETTQADAVPASHFESAVKLGGPAGRRSDVVDRLKRFRQLSLPLRPGGASAAGSSSDASAGPLAEGVPATRSVGSDGARQPVDEATGGVSSRRPRPTFSSELEPSEDVRSPYGSPRDTTSLPSVLVRPESRATRLSHSPGPPTVPAPEQELAPWTGPEDAATEPSANDTPALARRHTPAGGRRAASAETLPGSSDAGTGNLGPWQTGPDTAATTPPTYPSDTSAPAAPFTDSQEATPMFRDLGDEAAPVVPSPAATLPSSNYGSTASVSPSSPASASSEAGVLLTHESPLLSVSATGPRTIIVGRPAEYTVTIENASRAPAGGVEVQVTVPSWAEVLRTQSRSGSAVVEPDDQGNSLVRWQLRSLAGQANEQLTLQLVPRNSRPFDLAVTWSFTPASSTAHINVQEPKLELAIVGPQDVLYGETKVYTILISNPGTGPADEVVLGLMPLEPGERSPGQRQLGSLQPGERRSIEVELTARQAGRLQVQAAADAAGGLHAEAKQEVLVRRARLTVEVSGPPMEYAGSESTYTVRLTNEGDAAATDVMATATLPVGAQHLGAGDGGEFQQSDRQVAWRVGTLRPGAVRVLEFRCQLTAAGDNRVDVRTSGEGDLSAAQSFVTQVEALADLKLVVNDPKGAVPVGADTIYEVRVVNRGTKAAENVLVMGYFSEGIEPVAVSGWRGELSEGQVALERIPRIGPGQEMVIRVTAQAQRPGNHVFRAELECNEPETRLAQEEWTRFYGEAIEGQVESARRDPAPGGALLPGRELRVRR